MALTVPNIESSPTFDAQAITDSTDQAARDGAPAGTGVVSGCGVTPHTGSDMNVAIAAGVVRVAGVSVTVSAVTSTAVGAASTYDRKDIVVVNSSGVVSVVAGTPCATAGWTLSSAPAAPPVKPAIPSSSVLLAEVYVAHATTAIATGNILDKTMLTAYYTAIQVANVVVNTTQSATPAIDTDNGNIFSITGLAQAITSMTTNLTGTPVHGQFIWIEITDNGTARAITWGPSFANTGITLPTTTIAGLILRVELTWNVVTSTWDCVETTVASASGASLLTQVNGTTSGAITAAVGDVVNTTAAATVTLPASPTIGQAVLVNRGNHTALVTITANTGQTINGGAAAGSVAMTALNATANQGQALFIATSSTTWITISAGTDLAQGFNFGGAVFFQGTATFEGNAAVTGKMNFNAGGAFVVIPNQQTATYATVAGDFWIEATSGTWTLTLSNEEPGQVLFVNNTGTGIITVANVHNGPTTIQPGGGAIYVQDGTNFNCLGSWNTGGVASTPTLANGTSAQISTTEAAMLYLTVGTAGTAMVITMGPTSTPANTVVSSSAATSGQVYSLLVPKGWYVKWAATTATIANQLAVTL